MGDCVNVSLNNQTFQTSAVVIGANAGPPAVGGLTVYGDISASGRIYNKLDTGLFKMSFQGNGGPRYILSFAPSSNAQDYIVSVDGILQEANKSYFVSGNGVLTFTENIPVGSTILVLVFRTLTANSTNAPSFKKNFFIASGSTTTYSLNYYSNENASNYLVYLDGVMQAPDQDYTISQGRVVFGEAPISGQRVLVMSLQNQDGTYATSNSGDAGILQLSCIPIPTGTLNSQVLTYNGTTRTWQGEYVLPTTAVNGQVLTYDSSSSAWVARTPSTSVSTRGGGIIIKDQPGTSTVTIPANVGSIRVHVVGGGGGIGADGGDSVFSVTVNSTLVSVTAKGGSKGSINSGGKGGDVTAVAAITSIGFTGVGAGTGGAGGLGRVKGSAGTGSNGGYGGGGGGGTGGSLVAAYDTVPVGTVNYFTSSAVPSGYLECNGAVVSRVTYSDLFAVIGTTYNRGEQPILLTQFKLPDLRGEFIRGWDHGRTADAEDNRPIGGFQWFSTAIPTGNPTGGTHSNVTGSPGITVSRINETSASVLGGGAENPSYVGFVRAAKVNEPVGTVPSGPTNAARVDIVNVVTGDRETRPRNVALMPCIKALKTSTIDANQFGGGGGGSGIGGGGGGGVSGLGGSGSGYGGSGKSDAEWGASNNGYGGGAAATGYGGGGGGGYALFSINVNPGSTVTTVVGAAGTGGRSGAVIIEW